MFGRKHFAAEGEGAGGGAPPAVVPVAAPAAAPLAPAAPPAAVAAPPPVTAPAPAPVAPPAPAPPAAAPPAVDPTTDPTWIKARLEREAVTSRNKTLAELGITDLAAAKAAIASASAAAEATKSAEVRALEAAGRLTAVQTENARLASITREHAGRMLGVLTAEQQAAVRSLSPDTDPAGQLHAISVLGPTWAASQVALEAAQAAAAASAAAAALAAAPPPAAAPPAAAPPATTAPGATAPAGGPAASPPDHKSVYQTARATNPFAAAAYGLANPTEVYGPKA